MEHPEMTRRGVLGMVAAAPAAVGASKLQRLIGAARGSAKRAWGLAPIFKQNTGEMSWYASDGSGVLMTICRQLGIVPEFIIARWRNNGEMGAFDQIHSDPQLSQLVSVSNAAKFVILKRRNEEWLCRDWLMPRWEAFEKMEEAFYAQPHIRSLKDKIEREERREREKQIEEQREGELIRSFHEGDREAKTAPGW